MPEQNSDRPTVRCLRFCLNWLQIEQCTFVWHSAALVLHTMWQPHFSRLRSRSHCPWCVFHVRWKDKHSCNVMTLQCFWDSKCMCTHILCVCSFVWDCVHVSAYLLKLLITTTQLRMHVCDQRGAKWQSCLPLNGSSSPCVLIALHSVLLLQAPHSCLQKHDAHEHTTHADKSTHVDSEEPLPPEGMRPSVNFKWSWKQKCCWVINETNTHTASLSFSLSLGVPR